MAVRVRPSLPVADVVVGAGAAWVLQAVAFAMLYRALAAGVSAVRTWIAGMGARLGGLTMAFILMVAGPASGALGAAFGLALLGLLLLEAAWLTVAPPAPRGTPSDDRKPPRGRAEGVGHGPRLG